MLSHDYPELNDELANRLAGLLKELLEQERRSVTGASGDRQLELLEKIKRRETELNDEEGLETLFERHIADLSETERPENWVQKSRMLVDWEGGLKSELTDWKDELDELENRPIDKPLIFNSAKNKAMSLLQREARAADLLPERLELSDDGDKGKGKQNEPLGPLDREKNNKGKQKKGGGKKAFEQAKEAIQLMKEGKHYGDAFRLVAEKWSVTRHAVQWKCTGVLGIDTQKFREYVESGRIIQIMKEKYPQQIELIKRELEPLYS